MKNIYTVYVRVDNKDFISRRASQLRDQSVPKAINDAVQELQAILEASKTDPILKQKIAEVRIRTF